MHKYISKDYLMEKAEAFPFTYRSVYEHILENAPGIDVDEDGICSIRTNIYDVEEIHRDCTVQILRNSVTGEVSIGWWENGTGTDECELYNEPGD